MNVEAFIEARKHKNLSQNELADGICTQTTLSRFENNGQVPSLKILIKLCQKLDFPIGDLFPKIGMKNSELVESMDKVEFYFITSEYDMAQKILTELTFKEEDKESELYLRYLYLKGFLMIFKEQAVTDILFTFDQILLSEKVNEETIYSLLAYTGIGMTYSREKDYDKAEYYFSKVIEKIYVYPINKTEDTWRVLNIVFHSGVFYAEVGEIEASNALLNYAIEICSLNHLTYYLARAAFQLALNHMNEEQPKEVVLELLYDARAYAKINKNNVLLEKIKVVEQQIKTSDVMET
ncbi:helix-turn-helix domain-containing protein [Vagococcus fluvialis]|uniref:helix-turn-helix domain-containing protein n=1 Tax=Vagococcus fluvialis TaxID=2738 RepID=UPI003B5CF7CB